MEKIEKKMRKKKSFHSEIGLIDLFHIVLCSLNAVKNFLTLYQNHLNLAMVKIISFPSGVNIESSLKHFVSHSTIIQVILDSTVI